ncbi:MAG TPA: ArsR family transcriptional regulator [Thermoplasmatales archaeon]|nr:ArsR family transcriptional regulator [Thermoplasmatales archaeon]
MKRCCSLENIDVEIPEEIEREVEEKGGFEEICRDLSEHDLARLAAQMKVMGDEKRLAILYALVRQRMCVCMLAELTGCAYSKCSYHITKLKDAGLIEAEHLGNYIIYSLTPYGTQVIGNLKKIEEVEK